MRLLILLSLFASILAVTALPVAPDDVEHVKEAHIEKPVGLADVADAGDSHSNAADRKARFLFGGWGYRPWGWGGGWGGGGWGGGWGGGYGGWGGGWRRSYGGWGGGGWGWG